jgi:hypothetical protein
MEELLTILALPLSVLQMSRKLRRLIDQISGGLPLAPWYCYGQDSSASDKSGGEAEMESS